MKFSDLDVLDWTTQKVSAPPSWPEPGDSGELADGIRVEFWDYGVFALTPAKPGHKDVILSCAIHGNETAPIEMVRDMLHDIFAGKLKLRQRTLFLIGNPESIMIGKRFVDYNMNRLFSGAHKNGDTPEHKRAANIESYVTRFYNEAPAESKRQRLHYDLHTAIRDSKYEKFAVYPFTHGGPYKKEQLTFLAECGVTTILLNQAPTTTFSYYSVRSHGADAFTVELGKVRPFGENDMSRFADADRMFRQLVSQEELELPEFDAARHKIFDVYRTINRTQQGFRLNFPGDVANFTEFEQGHLLAVDDTLEYHVEQPGERIIFPNADVAIGQRALLTVVELPLEQLKLV